MKKMTEFTAKWAFMGEWWQLLLRRRRDFHGIVKPKVRTGSLQLAFRCLGFEVPHEHTYYGDSETRWIQQRDALELVFLQQLVDPQAFMATVCEQFEPSDGEFGEVWAEFSPDEAVPCVVDLFLDDLFACGKDAYWALWLLSVLLEPVGLQSRSASFQEARERILSFADESTRQKTRQSWTIPVHACLCFDDEAVTACAVEHMVELKCAMNALLARSTNVEEEKRRQALRAFPFRAASVDLHFYEMRSPDRVNQALDRLTAASGLELRNVDYHSEQDVPRALLSAIVQKLTQPNAGTVMGATEVEAELSFYNVNDNKRMGSMAYAHFLSAVAQRSRFQSVTAVDIFDRLENEERRFLWLWVIHAFFSPTASRKITSFVLGIRSLSDADIAALISYMAAKNPVAQLCHPVLRFPDACDPETQPRKRVHLVKDVEVLLSHSDSQPSQFESTALPSAGWYDVVQENDEFVDVVVPAHAQCRVHKGSVTA